MLLLASTSDKIRLTTGSALTVDVHASWIDNASGTITPGRTNTAITTATTTDIVASPASSTQRNVKAISIRNKDVSSDVVTVLHTDGTTIVQLFSCTLLTGEELCFDEATGWKHFTSAGSIKFDPIPQINNNQILANTSGAQAAPVGTSLSTYFDSAVSSSVGTLISRGVSGWGANTSTGTGSVVLSDSPTFTGTIGASGWNITAIGAATFNGNVNIGGFYQVSATSILGVSTNYTELLDSTGNGQILIGNATDQTNYYRNTVHNFQTRSGGTTLATINSTTVNALGTFTTIALGNQFGAAGGNLTTPTTTNTNILLYVVNTTTNWAGIGSDTGGNIYFVTGTGGGGGNPASRVSINTGGSVRFHNYTTGTLVTDASGNITASSDLALKENVADYNAGLDEVLNLRPVSFNWTEESELDTETEYVGFIAQEVLPHLPHAIGGPDGKHTLSDRPIIAALVNAVKELSAKVEALEAKVQSG